MKFQKKQIVARVDGGLTSEGVQTTVPTIVQAALADVILGNGATFDGIISTILPLAVTGDPALVNNGAGAATYALSNGQTLTLSINGQPDDTVTFDDSDPLITAIAVITPAEVTAVINDQLTTVVASIPSGNTTQIVTVLTGTNATLEVTGGTANGVLGFSTTATVGVDPVQLVVDLNQHKQIFVHLLVVAPGTLVRVGVIFEFEDPDHADFWIQSREGESPGTFRDRIPIARQFDIPQNAAGSGDDTLAAGQTFILASGLEHRMLPRARVTFFVTSGAVDAATHIKTSYHLDGGQTLVKLDRV